MLQKLFRADSFSSPFGEQTSALVIIDMQHDFVEPGGFGEALGNSLPGARRDCLKLEGVESSA